MIRRWARWRVVLALVVAGACGVPLDAEPRPIPDDRVPFDLLNPDAGPPPTPPTPPTSSAPPTPSP